MRIKRIRIDRWRQFDGIDISPPQDAKVVCVVGGNGSGKSQILELIAACAQSIGLTPGFEILRGNPLDEDDAALEVSFVIEPNTIERVDIETSYSPELRSCFRSWDRSLQVARSPGSGVKIRAGGIAKEEDSHFFAIEVATIISDSNAIHYLFLDADRAYPKVSISTHQLGDLLSRDWDEYANKQSSFKIARNLYDEWFRYLIGRENQANSSFIQNIRRARNENRTEPFFQDQFEQYKASVQRVLPHLLFVGIDATSRQMRFDASGHQLNFDQLSGGEREIAFLVGQIERFGIKNGLLLVDEPELHLNYDLLRSWIGYIKDSIVEGQIWLATHSLEVVEMAGNDTTIVLQRDENTRRVNSALPLNQQPVLATLSRAIGSPAFSIGNLAFLLIEGTEEIGECERFRRVCDAPDHVKFIAAGPCGEVIRRLDALKGLAGASGQSLRISGVIDADWRTAKDKQELLDKGLFVLGVHEVENFFLHPPTLKDFVVTNGGDPGRVDDIIRNAADKRAGVWIFYAARNYSKFSGLPDPSTQVRELAHKSTWSDFSAGDQRIEEFASTHGGLGGDEVRQFKEYLITQSKIYSRKRAADEIWRVCEGKEVFKSVLRELGVADDETGERAVYAVWKRRPELVPTELIALRRFVRSL